jgi:Tfp pilus assembly protein PilN
MRLNIDFARQRPWASARSLALLAASVLALAGVLWGGLADFETLRASNDRLRAKQLKNASRRIVLAPAAVEAINRAIRQLNLPWESLFAEIESRLGERVSLLALEPDAAAHILRIHGEARSPADMLDFVASLERGDPSFFHDAVLVRHEIVDGDPNKPIRFIAEVSWPAE